MYIKTIQNILVRISKEMESEKLEDIFPYWRLKT